MASSTTETLVDFSVFMEELAESKGLDVRDMLSSD